MAKYTNEELKNKIENGSKWNGIIYAKMANKNNFDLSMYVDGEYCSLGRVHKSDVTEYKNELEQFFGTRPTKEKTTDSNTVKECKNEWLVNEKKVYNNLNYAEMWDMYGTDFE